MILHVPEIWDRLGHLGSYLAMINVADVFGRIPDPMSSPGPKRSFTGPNPLTLAPSHPSTVELEVSFDTCENQGHPRKLPSGNIPIRTRITPVATFVPQTSNNSGRCEIGNETEVPCEPRATGAISDLDHRRNTPLSLHPESLHPSVPPWESWSQFGGHQCSVCPPKHTPAPPPVSLHPSVSPWESLVPLWRSSVFCLAAETHPCRSPQ